MDRSEKLALAARIEAAQVRLDRARERHATALRDAAKLDEAFAMFEAEHGRPMDAGNRADSRLFLPHLKASGAGALSRDEFSAADDAKTECHELQGALVEALHAFASAWQADGEPGQTALEWIGATRAEVWEAVQRALPDISVNVWNVDDARN